MLLDAVNLQEMCKYHNDVFSSRRSFHSFELSAEVSLNSDSQKADGRQNGDADWTSAGKKYLPSGIELYAFLRASDGKCSE